MLFNSYLFLLVFLPVVLAGFYLLGRTSGKVSAIGWLVAASLVFYAYWQPPMVLLLIGSIAANHLLARTLRKSQERTRGILCAVGIVANLLVLCYYKYTLFLLEIISPLVSPFENPPDILLPIGLSFYTFQQIAFLIDVRKAPASSNYTLLEYTFLISFFPQLIAGPIVHHHELLPQLANRFTIWRIKRFAPGIALFLIGLCKKAVFSDRLAPLSNLLFDTAASGDTPSLLDSWFGVASYSLQLYFDFSGYSDMACGLALMLNFRLPPNFNSPYKAVSLIDFWRRWHMTLSRFLRDYVYIPLGGNRGGTLHRHFTLMTTMLIGGLWHGAGWTFVIWGAVHGLGLAANHLWRDHRQRRGISALHPITARVVTILWVMIAWVFFRAPDFSTAVSILAGLCGLHGGGTELWVHSKANQLALVPILGLAVLFAPNSLQLLRWCRPATTSLPAQELKRRWAFPRWIEHPAGALCLGIVFLVILINMPRVSEFIYFQF